MNDLMKSTITTMEVADMMEISHNDILRKLDGRKDRKGYIQIMTESQMAVSDYFIPSTYRDISGKENKCYEVTKLGCDFLANKSTGEKGVLFTARYVKRFYEMEHQVTQIPITDKPGEVARLINSLATIMKNNQSAPKEIAENAKLICEQYGIEVVENFVKIPEYEQIGFALSGGGIVNG